ncbi:hypothetical protein KDW_50250 [Dictyobacter vulcani]|uniref:CopC domain-containing protein n=1 Tax=Dictyobacter vulcani TaxID=2607529 RepID=A0A5J4KT63_9CHLR|nr:copper resistance protein CopC [Dictyobacter vulcani]GER90863.1 hypothetical protein KDW_50250 [Dictyobacter vulcani]
MDRVECNRMHKEMAGPLLRWKEYTWRGFRLCLLAGVASCLCFWCWPLGALASPASVQYAEYMSSTPLANALLKLAPATVLVRFSAPLDVQNSKLIVVDVDGKQVNVGRVTQYHHQLDTLMINMQADQSEIYVVNWHTTSMQGHYRDSGSFRFFVHISSLLQSTLSKTIGNPSSFTPPGISPPASIHARKPDTITVPPAKARFVEIPLWIAGVVGLISLLSGIGLTWIFSKQAEERRAIELISVIEDE